jgi:hypothetical protein
LSYGAAFVEQYFQVEIPMQFWCAELWMTEASCGLPALADEFER